MSAPSRGAGASRARSTTPPTGRGRGARASSRPFQSRGHGRGAAPGSTNPRAEGLLQGLQAGTTARRGAGNGTTRGARGRGTSTRDTPTASRGPFANNSMTFNTPRPSSATSKAAVTTASTADFMAQAGTRFETLKRNREAERTKAIKDGFLADPEKKTTLENAITPVGTCTEMCPAFERVERIVQRMVDKSEKSREDNTKPDEERMVKRFRRSAAGYDEQLPSDIRTPATLKMTLDYLLDDIVGGGERLASIHKFVWDRTRGIRNDFSIQQVTRKEDVRIAVDCLERIARFHILSLHQLSNPENLVGEQFDAHQDREQLNNTLLSLMYYYDDNRYLLDFPNEAEFRAYCIIFELQSQHPDIEDRMQSWPKALLEDGRVKTAFKLYAAAGNTIFDQGPLRPLTTFSLAQGNTGSFWSLLASKQISYLMACVAEIYFGQIRYMALQALWTSATNAPVGTRAKNQDWTLEELVNILGFDAEEQAAEYCEEFGLKISTKENGVQYLDVSLNRTLEKSLIPTRQVFSYRIVEAKRFRRTLQAVINGKTVPQAVREGLVESDDFQQEVTEDEDPADDGESLFLPEKQPVSANPFANTGDQTSANPFVKSTGQTSANPFAQSGEAVSANPFAKMGDQTRANPFMKQTTSAFDPQAPAFTPGIFQQHNGKIESAANPFTNPNPPSSFAPKPVQAPPNPFGKAENVDPGTTALPEFKWPASAPTTNADPFSKNASGNTFSFTPQSTPPKLNNPPFLFQSKALETSTAAEPRNKTAFAPNNSSPFTGFTSQSASTSTNPLQPPVFSWPQSQQNTQNHEPNGPLDDRNAQYHSDNDLIRGATTVSPGMVINPQEEQPAPPALKRTQQPQLAPGPATPAQHLKNSQSIGATKHSTAPNGPMSAYDEPARKWPRQLPNQSTPQDAFAQPLSPFSPLDEPASAQTLHVIDSIETDASTLPPTAPLPPPAAQSNAPASQISSGLSARRTGFQWSDPTMPGYPRERAPAPTPKASKPRTAAEQQMLVNALAYVAMTQGEGNLMDEFSKFIIPGIIHEARLIHNAEVEEHNSKVYKDQYVLKKAVKRMEMNFKAKKMRLQREKRLRGLAELELQYTMEKKRQSKAEAEMEEIRQAMKESAQVQAEIVANERRKKKEKLRSKRALDVTPTTAENEPKAAEASRSAGKKRKSDVKEDVEIRLDLAGRPYLPRHKRAKTEAQIDMEQSNARMRPGRSLFSRKFSIFGSRQGSGSSQRPQSIDTTKTDYFRLKALGVDPDTPLIPLTAKQVERKRQEDDAAKARRAAEPPPWRGESSLRTLTRRSTCLAADIDILSSPSPQPLTEPALLDETVQTPLSETDELLAELRKLGQAQKEDAEWYKAQRELEELRDIEAAQAAHTIERRRSASLRSSTYMISKQGYEFVPAETRPGHTLSRTEQRIRNTGAHGLATAPIGGTPGYVKPSPDYIRRSEKTKKKNSDNGMKHYAGAYHPQRRGDVFVVDSQPDLLPDPQPEMKGPSGKGKGRAAEKDFVGTHYEANGYGPSPPGFSTVSPYKNNNEYDVTGVPEVEDHSDDDDNGDRSAAAEAGVEDVGDYEDDDHYEYEEEDGDEYGDEEEELDQNVEPSHLGFLNPRQLRFPSPDGSGAQSRGASSGPGASVDDAIELDSDSD